MSMVQPGLELPSYLAAIGYYQRGYAMAYDNYRRKRRYTYDPASRRAVRICPKCGDERIVYHSQVITVPIRRLCRSCSNRNAALIQHGMMVRARV